MAILKNRTQGHYVMINIAPMQDINLSTRERGLLFTIMSLPDNWEFSVRGLAKILPDGRESLSNSLNLLEKKGYLTRTQQRSGNGGFAGNVIEVHELPVIGEKSGEQEQEDDKAPKDAKKPLSAKKPSTGNPVTGNPTEYRIQEYKTQITGSIYQSGIDKYIGDEDGDDAIKPLAAYEQSRKRIGEQISYDALVHDRPEQTDMIDLILELLLAVKNTSQETIRIAGEPKPVEVVRGQFRKLTMFHVQYVLDSMKFAGYIRNPSAYILTSLYRSIFAMQVHTDNQVKNDMIRWNEADYAASDTGRKITAGED